MKLNAPKQITWLIALVIAVVGLVGELVTISVISDISFWLALIAAVLLLLATYFAGL